MDNWNFELVAGPFGNTTEGPAWDGKHLYFSLIQSGLIMRYDPKAGECAEWAKVPDFTNGLMFDSKGQLYGCGVRSRSILRFDAKGKPTTLVDKLDGKKLNTPNDLTIDKSGRIWFSNPWNHQLLTEDTKQEIQEQSILRADPQADGSWKVTRVVSDVNAPNGVLLSADECTLYVSQQHYLESELRELRAYPIHDDGSVGQYTVLHQFGADHRGTHRAIDGMCLDAEGNIVATAGWAKSGPGPLIYVFAPSGRVLETHKVPNGNPTNCTFGDADLGTLYVTTSVGHIYRVRAGRHGWNLYP